MRPLFGVFPVPAAARQDAVLEQVLLADRLGLDLVGIQDHPYQRRHLDAWTLISYLAGRTERVSFFPDVANLPLRHPGVLAKSAATLDRLSGGRVELGLGAGAFWEAIGAWGGPVRSGPESVDALVEAIGIIRRVWAAERGIAAEGEHYRMKGAHGGPGARARHRHLARRLRAADGADRRAARRRLGAVASRGSRSTEVPGRQDAIDEAARKAGRDPAKIRRVANLNGVIADGGATAGCAAPPSIGSRSSSSSPATCASTASSPGSTTRTSSARPSASPPKSPPAVRDALA